MLLCYEYCYSNVTPPTVLGCVFEVMKSFYPTAAAAVRSTRTRTASPADKKSPLKSSSVKRRHSGMDQPSENGSECSSTPIDMEEEDASVGDEASPGSCTPQAEGTELLKRRKKLKTPVPLKVCDNCSTQAVLHKAKKCHNCGKFFYDHWAKRCRIPPCPRCHFSRRSGGIKKLPTHCERCNYPLIISPCSSTSPPTGESSPDIQGDEEPLSPPPELTDTVTDEVGVARPDPVMPSVGYGSKDTPTNRTSLPPLPLAASACKEQAMEGLHSKLTAGKSSDNESHSGVALLKRKLGIVEVSPAAGASQEGGQEVNKSSIFSAILPTPPPSGNVPPFPLVPAVRHRETVPSSPLLEYAHSISARVYLPDEIKPDK